MSDYDPIQVLTENGYAPDSDALRGIGQLSVGAEKLKGTCGTAYIRTLVVTAQGLALNVRDLAALSAAHQRIYPHIVRGIMTPDVDAKLATDRADRKARALERNSRSNFARTAYYTVTRYLAEGGKLEDLDGPNVTKSGIVADADKLRARKQPPTPIDTTAAVPPRPTPTASAASEIQDAYNSLMSAIARFPQGNDAERACLDGILGDILDRLSDTRSQLTEEA